MVYKQICSNSIFKSIIVIFIFIVVFGSLDFLINLLYEVYIAKKYNNEESMLLGSLSMLFAIFITITLLEKIYSQKINLVFKLPTYFFTKTALLLFFFILGFVTPFIKAVNSNDNVVLLNPLNNIYYLLGGLLIAPFVEEILFRRIILSGLLTKYNYKVAIFITSLLFAFLHFTSLSQIFSAFMFGVFSGYLYFRTRNLLSVIFLHFFNNLIRTICNYVHYKYGASQVHSISDIYGKYSVYIISISLMLFVFLLFKRTSKYLVSRSN
mgnify:CR=1 FL=1|tara:strand:+ start:927 stop:1727 length:801 start_codon:yes stop_codon:yes gene_type:complete